ncbi:hypothetical protein A0256_03325 [Mucilaginibacter sp. PAMC 26640]|nr:hypothetical protein A0256_03325 [Mucilaginibacter sp. PAMC 26640]
MKKNVTYTIFSLLLIALSACKKDAPKVAEPERLMALQAAQPLSSTGVKPLTVVTMAGKWNIDGYRDGPGQQALFTGLFGITLTNDNKLFVADVRNNKIRVVTQEGLVSTLGVPSARDGSKLLNPYDVEQAEDGTVAIFAFQSHYDYKYKFWIWKPGGATIAVKASKNANYGGFSDDPYHNYYWTCGLEYTAKGIKGFIEQFLPNGKQGVNTYYLPLDSLDSYDRNFPVVSKIFSAYNGVKYLVVNNSHLYKYTPSGQLSRVAPAFEGGVEDIIANRDSRTLYLTSGGKIYSITNNKVTLLVGPRTVSDGRDGVGSSADVHALYLALSKDESTIYFTDSRMVRKLILK